MAAFLKWVADGCNFPSEFLKKNCIGVMSIGFCYYTLYESEKVICCLGFATVISVNSEPFSRSFVYLFGLELNSCILHPSNQRNTTEQKMFHFSQRIIHLNC